MNFDFPEKESVSRLWRKRRFEAEMLQYFKVQMHATAKKSLAHKSRGYRKSTLPGFYTIKKYDRKKYLNYA